MANAGIGGGLWGGGGGETFRSEHEGKTSDVNNKSMVPLEDYDGIIEAII